MCIRIKGDVVRQLNDIYEDIYFKPRYKEDLKERLLNFLDAKLMKGEETIVEKLKNSYKYMQIEEHEIKIIKQEFINEYKEELFNSFNPLWYSTINKHKKNLSKEAFLYFLKKTINLFEKNFKRKFGSVYFNTISLNYIKHENLYIYAFSKKNNFLDINMDNTQHEGFNIENDEELEKLISYFKKNKKIASLKMFEKYLENFEYYLEMVGSSYISPFMFYETETEIKEGYDDKFNLNKLYELVYLFENKIEKGYLVDPKTREYKEINKTVRESKSSEIVREENSKQIILFFNLIRYLFPEKNYGSILTNTFEKELEDKFNELFNRYKEENKRIL